jgi:hypothetical protein
MLRGVRLEPRVTCKVVIGEDRTEETRCSNGCKERLGRWIVLPRIACPPFWRNTRIACPAFIAGYGSVRLACCTGRDALAVIGLSGVYSTSLASFFSLKYHYKSSLVSNSFSISKISDSIPRSTRCARF